MGYFDDEIACQCCGENNIKDSFHNKLTRARELAGIPFVMNSMCRCDKHNEKIGGKKDSGHLRGHAGDISCNDSRSRFIIVNALLVAGFSRIGIGKTFIHADDDTDKDKEVVWLY